MCAGNAMVEADGQGNRMFDKKKSRGRIDGLVTLAMGVGAADNELDDGGVDLTEYLRKRAMYA
jgi:phage terminase large subunit-like protein